MQAMPVSSIVPTDGAGAKTGKNNHYFYIFNRRPIEFLQKYVVYLQCNNYENWNVL